MKYNVILLFFIVLVATVLAVPDEHKYDKYDKHDKHDKKEYYPTTVTKIVNATVTASSTTTYVSTYTATVKKDHEKDYYYDDYHHGKDDKKKTYHKRGVAEKNDKRDDHDYYGYD